MPLVLEDPDELIIIGAVAEQATLDAAGAVVLPGEGAIRISKEYLAPFRHADRNAAQAQQDVFAQRAVQQRNTQPAQTGPVGNAANPNPAWRTNTGWERGRWRRHRWGGRGR